MPETSDKPVLSRKEKTLMKKQETLRRKEETLKNKEDEQLEKLRLSLARQEYEEIATLKKNYLESELEKIRDAMMFRRPYVPIITEPYDPKYKRLEDVDIEKELIESNTIPGSNSKTIKRLYDTIKRKGKPGKPSSFDTLTMIATLKKDKKKKEETEVENQEIKSREVENNEEVPLEVSPTTERARGMEEAKYNFDRTFEPFPVSFSIIPPLGGRNVEQGAFQTAEYTESGLSKFDVLTTPFVGPTGRVESLSKVVPNMAIFMAIIGLLTIILFPVVYYEWSTKGVAKNVLIKFHDKRVHAKYVNSPAAGWFEYQDKLNQIRYIIGGDIRGLGKYGPLRYLIKAKEVGTNMFELYDKPQDHYIFDQYVEIRFIR